MIETVTPRSERSDSEHLSFTSSPSASASSERSVEVEIRVLPISRASAIPTPPPSLPENNEDRELRRSERQMKARDFWESGFTAFLAMMTVIEASAHYKNVLNR